VSPPNNTGFDGWLQGLTMAEICGFLYLCTNK